MKLLISGQSFTGKHKLKQHLIANNKYVWDIQIVNYPNIDKLILHCLDRVNIICVDATKFIKLNVVQELISILCQCSIRAIIIVITKLDIILWDLIKYKQIEKYIISAIYPYCTKFDIRYIILPISMSKSVVNIYDNTLLTYGYYNLINAIEYANVYMITYKNKNKVYWATIQLDTNNVLDIQHTYICLINNEQVSVNILCKHNEQNMNITFDRLIDTYINMPLFIKHNNTYICGKVISDK